MPITQYDSIGDRYKELTTLPAGLYQQASVEALVGDITGLTVLDLACGDGAYSQKAVKEWGVQRAVGVDISPSMVQAARRRTQNDPRVDFLVADCAQPFDLGQFDLVLACWFLNYASNEAEMQAMWQNIFNSLKPGGRVIGICPNLCVLEGGKPLPESNYYGQGTKEVEKLENGGAKMQITLHTSDPFSFQTYHLPREIYNKAAKVVGMEDIQWVTHPNLDIPEIEVEKVLECPLFNNFTAVRPLA